MKKTLVASSLAIGLGVVAGNAAQVMTHMQVRLQMLIKQS